MKKISSLRNYLEENKDNIKRYRKLEELTVVEMKKGHPYPMLITTNQIGEIVEIGKTFLKLYYTQTPRGTYLLTETPTILALSVNSEIKFTDFDGKFVHLKPNDYLIVDENKNITGLTCDELKSHYVPFEKFPRIKRKLLTPKKTRKTKSEEKIN